MNVTRELEIFKDGLVDLISEEELINKLNQSDKEKRPLKIKYGVDPSRPDIHLGHTVPLNKLRALQERGHIVVFLIGDFTARIGDPSGKNETRPMLSNEEVRANAETYQEQVFKILDKKKTEVVYNSDWLNKLTPVEFLGLMSRYTIARILERDDFQKRYQAQTPISLLEFMYPLLQGYDSVVLKSDIEVGGTDQKFNLLVGRELQRDWGIEPQVVMTLPILEGTDGTQKMSKSLNNAIDITSEPNDMFGKVMSIPDSLIMRYWQYATGTGKEECELWRQKLAEGENPRNVKAALGQRIVERYYGTGAAEEALAEFNRIFREKNVPTDMPEIKIEPGEYKVVDLVVQYGLCESKGEAKRLIKQAGLKIDGEKVNDIDMVVKISSEILIQCGKR
ncbi:MAG: tyrosine--tRNA ligase, partial [Candidatus Omnitrophica bacterium]|nr:tyrosine--tRNA ligase [Candidatus Omnitrophota bacterium]